MECGTLNVRSRSVPYGGCVERPQPVSVLLTLTMAGYFSGRHPVRVCARVSPSCLLPRPAQWTVSLVRSLVASQLHLSVHLPLACSYKTTLGSKSHRPQCQYLRRSTFCPMKRVSQPVMPEMTRVMVSLMLYWGADQHGDRCSPLSPQMCVCSSVHAWISGLSSAGSRGRE